MKIRKKLFSAPIALLAILSSCSKEDDREIDTEYPEINISAEGYFPKQCSQLKRGDTFVFSALFTDNQELGSSSIDIHHNFDHHTHSTEVQECNLDLQKHPVNPFLFIQNYDIPTGLTTYEIRETVSIPEDIDPGDYHFMIRLTDTEGWKTIKGLSIKII